MVGFGDCLQMFDDFFVILVVFVFLYDSRFISVTFDVFCDFE